MVWMEVGLGPGNSVRRGPSSPTEMGTAAPDFWLVLFSVKGSLKLWALVSIFSEWFTEM